MITYTIRKELTDYSLNRENTDTGHRDIVYRGVYLACLAKKRAKESHGK